MMIHLAHCFPFNYIYIYFFFSCHWSVVCDNVVRFFTGDLITIKISILILLPQHHLHLLYFLQFHFLNLTYYIGFNYLFSVCLPLKLQYFGHLMRRTDSLQKTLMLGKIEGGRRRKGMTEDEVAGQHHRLNGHEFKQAPGVGDGQGSLSCCSPCGRKESDTTSGLN